MPELRDVAGYLCRNYPHKSELSKARLTKLVYLADWKSAIDRNQQMTSIKWLFNRFGPYVDDIVQIATQDDAFTLRQDRTMFGNKKETIALTNPFDERSLTEADRHILDHVIEQTRKLSFDAFIQLVYSTYPILTGAQGSDLDLIAAADRYKALENV